MSSSESAGVVNDNSLNEDFDLDVNDDDPLPDPRYFIDSQAMQYGLSESQTRTVHKLVRVRSF